MGAGRRGRCVPRPHSGEERGGATDIDKEAYMYLTRRCKLIEGISSDGLLTAI